MKKYLLTSIIIFFILNIFCGIAHCCSGYSDRSHAFLRDDFELCFINFDNNIEKLLFKVSLAKHFNETNSVLILPILKQTSETQIKIVNSFPDTCGNNFDRYFDYKCISSLMNIFATQIHTFPFLLFHWRSYNISDHIPKKKVVDKTNYSKIMNIKVLESDKKSILEFLTINKLNNPHNLNNILDTYNSNEYSLIMIWPNQDELKKIENKNISLGILISLNTSKIFYPFKWTFFFNTDNLINKFCIYLIGHGTLNYMPKNIKPLIMTNYSVPDELSEFFFNKTFINYFYYSQIFFTTPPISDLLHNKPYLTDDYIINSNSPNNSNIKKTIIENLLLISIILLLIISFISSSLAAIITFRKFQPSIIKFALFGFFNIFSLLGLTLATYYFNISKIFTNGKLPIVKFKTEYLASCVVTTLIIYFSILALIFFTANIMPTQGYGELYLLIFIAVLIVQLIFRLNYYNGLYLTLFSVFFCIFMIISLIIYQKYNPI